MALTLTLCPEHGKMTSHKMEGFPALSPCLGPYPLSEAAALIKPGHQLERPLQPQSDSPDCSFFGDFAESNKKRKKINIPLLFDGISAFNCKLISQH